MQRTPTCENCLRNYELRECLPVGNRIPLLLPCGHTFCEGCILKATKNKTEVSCFKCDVKIQCEGKGEAGVKTLLPNIYLLGLLLYNRRIASDKISGGTVSAFNGVGNVIHNSNSSLTAAKVEPTKNETTCEDKMLCEECNEKVPSCQCNKCGNIKFCDSCFQQVHKTSKLLMKHNPSPIELSSTENQLKCDQHDRKLEFYDKDASAAVCAICIISERCRGHDVVLLSEMNNDTPSKIDSAVKNAKETLFWWQNSSKILTKILPDEYMEANALFDDIQSKFNAFHTILQKRQLELMLEASEKLCINGGIHEQLSDLSRKIGSLSTVLRDVEMVVQDKDIMNLKSNEVLKKLEAYNDAPCIVRQKTGSKENSFKFHLEDEALTSLERLGEIQSRPNDIFMFKKKSDVSDEFKDRLKSGDVTICDEGEEEISSESLGVVGSNKVTSKCSLLSNCNVLVCVTDVTSPAEFKVQKVSDKDRLQVLMTELNKYCRYANSSDNLLHTVEDGQLVCAQFLSDNNWYRARVTNKWCPERPDVLPSWSNGLSIEVVYIDYGNFEYLPLTRLRKIPKEFLEVPEMAVTCCLTDIEPPANNDEWPERSKKAFASLTGDRPMMMTIFKRVGCKVYVDLRKPDDDEPTRDDDRPASVRNALVFLEVASFKSTDSSTKEDNMHKLVRKYTPYEKFPQGEFVDIVVTHIDHPEAIFIQKLDSPIHDEQTRLGLVYNNSRNKKGWMIDYPYRNLVCTAKFSADKAWYRAEVLRVDNNDTVEVEYVDYGNREKLPFSELRKIPDMYVEMPKQCTKVKLFGMKLQEGEEDYSKQSKEFLHKFFLGKPLVAFIKEFDDDDLPVVVLYDTSTDADINMNELLQRFVMKCKHPDPIKDAVADELENIVSSVVMGDNLKEEKDSHKETSPFPTYLPPEIPNYDRFTATGVHIDDKANIYLHVTCEDSCVSDIMQQLNCDGGKLKKCPVKSAESLHPKQAVVGKFSEDNLWYRAEIVCIINDNNVKVRFIDFGNVEETDVSNLCLEPAFLNIPCQCIRVCLSGVVPIDDEWSTNAIALLREYIVSEVVGVEMKIKNKTKILSALIYADESSTINHMLLNEGLATVSDNKPKKEPAYLNFTEQKLPKHGLKFDVMVTQVNQPDIIYIQRLPVNNDGLFCGDLNKDDTVQDAYDNLMSLESFSEIINREGYFDGCHLFSKLKPVVGMACVCMYTSDGLYYRARIENIDNEKGVVEVVYVDYGTSEIVSVDCLLPLPPELIKLPMQAFKVRIAGIKPVEQNNNKSVKMLRDTNWTIESMEIFFGFVANKRLIAEIIHTDSDMPTIHLYDQTMKDGVADLIYIGEKMKERNLAAFDI